MEDIGLWAASFKMVNADGYTDYFDGFTPADPYISTRMRTGVTDNILYDFADPRENMIAEAIHHSITGAFQANRFGPRRASGKSSRVTMPVQVRYINQPRIRHLLKD